MKRLIFILKHLAGGDLSAEVALGDERVVLSSDVDYGTTLQENAVFPTASTSSDGS